MLNCSGGLTANGETWQLLFNVQCHRLLKHKTVKNIHTISENCHSEATIYHRL